MKKLLKSLGFAKADEMQKSIYLKSIKLAWVYTVAVLLVWALADNYQAKRLNQSGNTLIVWLLVSQNMVLIISQLFYQYRMTGDEDEGSKKTFAAALCIMAIVVIVIVAVGLLTRLFIG